MSNKATSKSTQATPTAKAAKAPAQEAPTPSNSEVAEQIPSTSTTSSDSSTAEDGPGHGVLSDAGFDGGFLSAVAESGFADSFGSEAFGDALASEAPSGGGTAAIGGPTGSSEVDSILADVYGPAVLSLPRMKNDPTSAKDYNAKAFTEGSQITLGGGIKADPTDAESMAVIGEEVAHALAGGGTGQHEVDQEGDPGEASAQKSGSLFADYAAGGAKIGLGPAWGGLARIHRAVDEDEEEEQESERDESESEDKDSEEDAEDAAAEEEATEAAEEAEAASEEAAEAADTAADAAEAVEAAAPDLGGIEATVDIESAGESPAMEVDAATFEAMDGPAQAVADAAAAEMSPEAAAAASQEAVQVELDAIDAAMELDPTYTPEAATMERVSAAVETAVAGMDPAAAADYMSTGAGAAAVEAVAPGFSDLANADLETQAQAQAAMDSLTAVAEAVGPEAARSMAETMVSNGAFDTPAAQEMLENSIATGIGATLGASAAVEVTQNPSAATYGVQTAYTSGMARVQETYTDARQLRADYEADYASYSTAAATAAGQGSVFDAEQLAAGRAAFDAQAGGYDEMMAAESAAAANFGNSLRGDAILADAGFISTFSPDQRQAVSTLHETTGGRIAVADALQRSGAGELSWTDTLANDTGGWLEASSIEAGIRESIEKGSMEGVALSQAVSAGGAATDIVEGAANALEGRATPGLIDALREIAPQLSGTPDPARHQEIVRQAAAAHGIELTQNGRPTLDGTYVERLGVFSAAGVEHAAANPRGFDALGDLARQAGAGMGRLDAASQAAGGGPIGPIQAGLKAVGSLDGLLNHSETFRQYASNLVGLGGSVAEMAGTVDGMLPSLSASESMLARGTGVLGAVSAHGGAALAALDLIDTMQRGNLIDSAQAAAAVTLAANQVGRFMGKRATGFVGLAIDAVEIGQALHATHQNIEASGELLGPAAAEQLGISLELGERLGRWAGMTDGRNLQRLEAAANEQGVTVEDLARDIMTRDPVQRELALETLRDLSAGPGGSAYDMQTRLGAIDAGQAVTRGPNELETSYEARVQHAVDTYYSDRFAELQATPADQRF